MIQIARITLHVNLARFDTPMRSALLLLAWRGLPSPERNNGLINTSP
jgi:hypothetical protein